MNNNYALGLLVGVKNQFTKGAKEIQAEYKKLSTEHNKLQSKVKDVDAYKQAQSELKSYRDELKKMSNPSEEAEAKLHQLTNSLSRQSRALKKAGIDTNDLALAQNKLQKELQQTASKMNSVNNTDLFNAESMAGIGLGVTTLAASAQSGMNTNRVERQASASTGIELETIQSWRNALADIETQTARPYQEILNARIQASQSGYDDNAAIELTKTSAELSAAFQNLNWQPQEVMSAQMRLMKSFDISASQAADLIATTAQKSGDDRGDLLDTITEYSSTYADQGLNVDTVFAQLIAGRQAGVFNYDKIGDQLKETLQARLSDPDQFKKLIGTGDKQGSIDELIKDPALAKSFKNSLFDMRNAMSTGEGTDAAYGNMMMQLASLYKADKSAARNMAEGVGGTILAEDIGIRGIEGIAQAAYDPKSVLGDYEGTLSDAMEVAISPTQKLMTEISAMGRAASTSLTELENLSEGLLDFVGKGASVVREGANDNALIAGALTLGAGAATIYGGAKGTKLIKDNIMGLLAGGIKAKNDGGGDASKPGKFSFLGERPDHQRNFAGKFNLGAIGKVFKPLAILTSAIPTAKAISDGNYKDAGKTAASLGGGLAGMKVGALAGGIGGPLGIAVGGVAGGILGSIFGEQALDGVMDYFSPESAKEIESATKNANDVEKALAATTQIENTISVKISAPVTIESGATVPDDFQEQLIKTFRHLTPELTEQLRETLETLSK
ncbi:phage tail tape measure protein [Vibrio sp. OPT18]|uniref:phage tail tape measure protein n=1 Tax=Vibrio sp. OPT18 TaxID=2778641 RepID=UPI001881AEDD|nr:phage tail tape measure protein [Vibrio sp. OPT18]MBE8578725.1 phage tail tape measure protein [Vibrio sp. OPT18]